MAVAQDLPALEDRAQYKRAAELGRLRPRRHEARDPDQQPGPDPARLGRDLADHEGGRGRDRGPALLRAPRGRLPGHRPRRLARTSSPAAPPRAPRRSPSSSSRTRSRPRAAAPCSRSCARRRSPTSSSASGQGQDPHRVPERRSTSARAPTGSRRPRRPTSAGTTRAAASPDDRCAAVSSLPWEAAMLAGDDLLAERLRPADQPRGRARRGATSCSRTCATRATSPSEEYSRHTSTAAAPDARRRSSPPTEDSRRPTSPPGCASSSSTSTAPARRSAAGCRSSRRSTSTSRTPAEQIVSDRPRRRRPDRRRRRARQRHRRRPGDGRRPRLRPAARSTWPPRPPPAGLLVQAVHAGDGARAGPLARRGLHLGARSRSRSRPRCRARTARRRSSPTSSGSTTTTTTTSARASIATATTYSDNSVYSQLGLEVGERRQTARSIETDPPDGLSIDAGSSTNPALILGGLKTASPRSRWPTPTRRSPTAATGSAARWPPRNGDGPVAIDKVTDDEDELVPDNDRRQRREREDLQAGDRPDGRRDRDGHPPHRGHRRHRQQRPDRRRLTAGARPARPRTTATPGSAAPTRTSPPASGSATPTRRRRWRPSTAARPVDGGTFPALIWARVISAYDRPAGRHATPATRPTRPRRPRAPATYVAPDGDHAPAPVAPAGPDRADSARPAPERRRRQPAAPAHRWRHQRRHRRRAADGAAAAPAELRGRAQPAGRER